MKVYEFKNSETYCHYVESDEELINVYGMMLSNETDKDNCGTCHVLECYQERDSFHVIVNLYGFTKETKYMDRNLWPLGRYEFMARLFDLIFNDETEIEINFDYLRGKL
jgi:hypothetical protein